MALTPYCTNAEVRAALGVTISELKDEVLDLPIYEMGLRRSLNQVSPSLPAAFSSVLALTDPLSEVQKDLLDAVRIFATYSVARQAGAGLGMAAPKSLNDDKSGFSRFADAPYKDALQRVSDAFLSAKMELEAVWVSYSGAGSTSATPGMPVGLVVSSRSYDPVTGS